MKKQRSKQGKGTNITKDTKYTRHSLDALRPPSNIEACEEKYTRAAKRARDEELAKFLDEVRAEIKAQAKERLTQWVAEQKRCEARPGRR